MCVKDVHPLLPHCQAQLVCYPFQLPKNAFSSVVTCHQTVVKASCYINMWECGRQLLFDKKAIHVELFAGFLSLVSRLECVADIQIARFRRYVTHTGRTGWCALTLQKLSPCLLRSRDEPEQLTHSLQALMRSKMALVNVSMMTRELSTLKLSGALISPVPSAQP